MSGYISKELAAEQAIAELEAICITSPRVKAKVRRRFEELPDADVAKVIRCRSCRFHDKNWDSCTYWHDNPFDQATVKPTDFCSFGEKQEHE